MVFIIRDDLLAPKGPIILTYKGPNPFGMYKILSDTLQLIFQIKGKDIYEPDFRWDITSDPRKFFFIVFCQKGFDKFSKMNVTLKCEGKQPTDITKSGEIVIEIKGGLETKYPSESMIQRTVLKPFIYFYHWTIYNNIRRQYIEFSKRGIEQLESEIRSVFNLVQRGRLS